jgi:hypothetical protein
MNLQGAVNMIMSENDEVSEDDDGDSNDDGNSVTSSADEKDDEDVEMAVDIIESVRLGTGARITCLAAWCKSTECQLQGIVTEKGRHLSMQETKNDVKRKHDGNIDLSMDGEAVKRARSLVEQAKKLKKKREKKLKKKLSK